MGKRAPGNLTDEQLFRQGRDALWLESYREASEALQEYCERLTRKGRTILPVVLAYYGLAVGHARNVRDGMKICQEALSSDRGNPDSYLCLARLYVLSGSKKRALDVISQGLRVRANHRGLNALRARLGVRQGRPVPFLPRESTVNVHLGKALKKLKKKIRPATALA